MAEATSFAPPTALRPVLRVGPGGADWVMDEVATEMPLTLYVNNVEVATLVATPTDLEDLVYGFMVSEGIVANPQAVRLVEIDAEAQTARVLADADVSLAAQKMFERRYIASCCGKGRASIYFASDASALEPITGGPTLTAEAALALVQHLQGESDIFRRTGGVHNVALAHPDGSLVAARADIGRHNALDKLYGHCLQQGIHTSDLVCVLSGRVSSEMLLKAAKLRVAIVVTKAAPTELALALAEEVGVTVVGFARGERINVYTHAERILVAR
ncbi:MAG: formate dehydrogenase accessory sulfurtransferase FdhD [Thermaerobacter sp.]|nr:formate dehydrogenase accessory sulfurtransferase FdhD [Thermaerobacter sp.]